MINNFDFYYQNNIPFLFLINYDTTKSYIEPLHSINSDEILFSFPGGSNNSGKYFEKIDDVKILSKPTYSSYKNKFLKIHKELFNGNSYLLNLTCKSAIDGSCGLKNIFHSAEAKYKLYFKDELVFFSPESFVKIENSKISTYPMKGTASAEKENSLEKLMNDPKESAEHITVVDLLRNDLSRVCSEVHVTNYRYAEKLNTSSGKIWQTSSCIEGELREEFLQFPSKIFEKILPAGSVTGAPKKETVRIINDTEDYDRGWYTGIAGLFDGNTIDTCVIIRCIEKQEGNFHYKSGGGITIYSDPKSEYEELIRKIYVPIN